MAFVLDSSAMLAMLVPDEQSAAADTIADLMVQTTVHVPSIWPLEVRNALLAALRSKRISIREFQERASILDEFPVEVDFGAAPGVLARTTEIALRHNLSAYDGSYLELARRHGFALATFDSRLRKACAALKVRTLP